MKKGDIFSRYWCKSLIRSKGQVAQDVIFSQQGLYIGLYFMQDILKQLTHHLISKITHIKPTSCNLWAQSLNAHHI